MKGYYLRDLAGDRLRRCYEIAPPRVKRYLDAEVRHVAARIRRSDTVLELGCGYGRVLADLAARAARVVGIDTSRPSLQLARAVLRDISNCRLVQMDAAALGFRHRVFDVVVCVQNGISAFHVDRRALIAESIRVVRAGGRLFFSSYAARFWEDRLEWFQLQSEEGLVGPIDREATGDGAIVCTDGFISATVGAEEFQELTRGFNVHRRIDEVDGSSLFCDLVVRE